MGFDEASLTMLSEKKCTINNTFIIGVKIIFV